MLLSQLERLLETVSIRDPALSFSAATAPGGAVVSALLGSDCSDPVAVAFAALSGYLYGPAGVEQLRARLLKQCDRFRRLYGDGPVFLLRAPARINILGEHVDYVSYLPTLSLTFGSREHDMVLMYRAIDAMRVRGASFLEGAEEFEFEMSAPSAPVEPLDAAGHWEHFLISTPRPAAHWANYVRGAAHFALFRFGYRIRRGLSFVVDSSIPSAGGASSSSALTVLAGAALRQANGIGFDSAELARESAQAEWFVGTRGGAMDHATICLARHDHIVAIFYGRSESRLVPLRSPEFRWVTFFSHSASKGNEVMLDYNERAAVSRILIPALIGLRNPDHPEDFERPIESLPEAITLDELEHTLPAAFAECCAKFPLLVRDRRSSNLKVRDRGRHHLGEVRRAEAALHLLTDTAGGEPVPDSRMQRLGVLLNEAHRSLRDLYEVCTPEVNRLTEVVLESQGVYGARIMGGGFGGNVLALVRQDCVEKVVARVQSEYYASRGRDAAAEGAVMVSTPGEGLSGLDPESAANHAADYLAESATDRAAVPAPVQQLLRRLGRSRLSGSWHRRQR